MGVTSSNFVHRNKTKRSKWSACHCCSVVNDWNYFVDSRFHVDVSQLWTTIPSFFLLFIILDWREKKQIRIHWKFPKKRSEMFVRVWLLEAIQSNVHKNFGTKIKIHSIYFFTGIRWYQTEFIVFERFFFCFCFLEKEKWSGTPKCVSKPNSKIPIQSRERAYKSHA